MNSDQISKAPAQDITSTDTDTEGTETGTPIPKVFDITPDLNISPAKDDVENNPPITIPENILNQNLESNKVQTETVAAKIATPPVTQFGPANPPAKTIGTSSIPSLKKELTETNNVTAPVNLQEAVSTININPKQIPTKPISDRPWETKPDAILKPLRTYETDFAEAMAKKRISTSSFVIAEDKKKQKEKLQIDTSNSTPIAGNIKTPIENNEGENNLKYNKPHSTRNWILGLLSLVLIVGGGLIGYSFYLKSPVSPVQVIQPMQTVKPLLAPDLRSTINIDGKNINSIVATIKSEISKPQEQGTIKEIILTKMTGDGETKVTAQEMSLLAEIQIPDLIKRSLSSDWMLGVYSGTNGLKHLFVITTNNFFQNTFAGLIQWEKTMPQDLKQYLYSDSNQSDDLLNFTTQGQFKDRIIRNRDVREYVTSNGHIIFLYSFISNDKLVISNSEEVLETIIQKLEKNAFVR